MRSADALHAYVSLERPDLSRLIAWISSGCERGSQLAGAVMYELTICNAGGEILRRFDMDRAERAHKRLLIGRAEDCDVRIAHALVSRHHCAIELVDEDEQEWIVRDLGSTHGVLVGGERVPEVTLKPGLTVVIGPAVLKFELALKSAADQIRAELGER